MPRLGSIQRFPNLRSGEISTLKDQIDVQKGTIITENWMKNAENIIIDYYKEKGYYDAVVNISSDNDPNTPNTCTLLVEVKKGGKVKIGEIVFDEALEFPEKKAAWQIKRNQAKKMVQGTKEF